MDLSPFHLAIPVQDIGKALTFYEGVLGCTRGRECQDWVDLNFLGHQLVLHRVDGAMRAGGDTNLVDGEHVPIPHFGVVLVCQDFEVLIEKLIANQCDFVIPPTIRFEGLTGEQRICFLRDPSGNCLEFKSFSDPDMLFAQDPEASHLKLVASSHNS